MADEKQTHMIRRQVFDLHLSEEKQAKALQDKLSSIFSSELTLIIESVLDEFSQVDEMIRFDRLDVDLGDIPPDHFLDEFKKRLQLKLRQVLAAEIVKEKQDISLPKITGPQRIPIVHAKLDLLIHFLEYGYLSPWARGKEIELPHLFEELISHEPLALSQAMRHIGDPIVATRRFVEQFSVEQQLKLQELLIPGNAAILGEARMLLEKTFRDSISKSIPTVEVRKEFAIATFQYALEHEVAYGGLDRKKWIEKLIQTVYLSFGESESQQVIQAFTSPQNSFFTALSPQQLNTLKADWIKKIVSKTDVSVEDDVVLRREGEGPKPKEKNISSLHLPSRSSGSTPTFENGEIETTQSKRVVFQSPKAEFPLQAQIDLIIHSFFKDEWPWWAPESLQSKIPEQLLTKLIEKQANMVSEQFFNALSMQIRSGSFSREFIGKRISKQLSFSTQLSLIELITPQISGFLFLLNRFVQESFEADKQLPSILWEKIWTYLLEKADSSTSSELLSLLKFALPALAERQNISPNKYYQQISKIIFLQRQKGETRFFPIQSLLIQLMQEEEASSKQQEKNLQAEIESINDPYSDSPDQKSHLLTHSEEGDEDKDYKETIADTPALETLTTEGETIEEQVEKIPDSTEADPQVIDGKEALSTSLNEESPSMISSELPIPTTELDQELKKNENESSKEKSIGSLPEDSLALLIPETEIDVEQDKKEGTPLSQEIHMGALPEYLIEEGLTPEDLDEVKQHLRIFSYFLRYGSFPSDKPAPSQQAFEEMIISLSEDHPRPLAQLFGKMILVVDIRIRIMEQLSDHLFETLIQILPSVQGSDLLAHYRDLRLLSQETHDLIPKDLLKQELLAYVIAQIGRTPVPYQYIQRLLKRLGRQGVKVRTTVLLPLTQAIEKSSLPHKKELVEIFTLINQELIQLEQVAPTRPPVQAVQRSRPLGDLPINIENAGLVLIWPFIPHYFKMLDFLTPTRKFKQIEDAKRAVHLLQYIVRKSTDEPEERLVLNKLMCGVPLAEPIEGAIEITEKEAELAESLLQAACGQWTAMKNATPDGLRGSFLIRNGKLDKKLKNWEVKVEKKPYDMLIDRLPWSISMVKFPWMDSILQVEWR